MNIDRELDQVKSAAFTDSNAAFLGCLLCRLNFSWNDKIQSAQVTETDFYWNKDWFKSLTKEERKSVLLHELWHIGLLHGLRIKHRDPELWNIACDIRINNDLVTDGYTLPPNSVVDMTFQDKNISEEEIYSELEKLKPNYPPQSWGSTEFTKSSEQISLVQEAVSVARFAGNVPGNASQALNDFLKPKLPWTRILHNYLLDKLDPEWSWSRPNRRFRDIYLPSLLPQEGRLITVAMFLDTSGSISTDDIKRFTSEVKFVQEVMNPEKLHVIQFDTEIKEEKIYTENDRFTKIDMKGFGGTSYREVREYILKHKPTVSIIFTDLYCRPMQSVGKNQVIWIVKNNPKRNAEIGKTIHVDD